MKEEAETSSKLPPKIILGGVGGSSSMATSMIKTSSSVNILNSSSSSIFNTSTTSKQQSDEILSALLRMNNFDSISSIKDESLDIDLSACVTISADPSGIIGGNSLSSSDFWRALDESAQTSQLDVSNCGAGAIGNCSASRDSSQTSPCTSNNSNAIILSDKNDIKVTVKKEQTDFSGTFLKPSSGISFSPLKRSIKPLQVEQKIRKEKHNSLPKSDLGPPSLAPIIRVQQTFIKPHAENQKQHNSNNVSSTHHIMQNHMYLKEPVVHVNQPPPLAALEMSKNNKESAVKPLTLPEPLYKCLDCDNQIVHGSQELTKHANHRIVYKCTDCEREFDLETSLKKHLKTHRPLDARKDAWKKCPDCGKCLKLGSMWMHRKIHTENKKYGCEICGQKFVQKINLTHHQRIHTSEKPYECSECQKRFQERSHLQRHQKYHAQTRSYRCEKCGKMYKTERCLKVHNLVHLEQRPFACTVCDKSFISNSKLKQHSNIHTGERPFKCNYCPRDFTNFPNWLKHTRRRHKVDHKTGEMLENIPSYCSKKSTRAPKEKKTAEDKTTSAPSTTKSNANSNTNFVKISNETPTDLTKLTTKDLQNHQQILTFSNALTTSTAFTSVTFTKPLTSVTMSNSSNHSISTSGPPPLAKVPAKRKKKQNPVVALVTKSDCNTTSAITASTSPTINYLVAASPRQKSTPLTKSNPSNGPPPLALVYNSKPVNLICSTLSPTNATNSLKVSQQSKVLPQQTTLKVEKIKRERKQPMPKQVQQVPPPLIIKKEFIEPKPEINVPLNEQQQNIQDQHKLNQHRSQQQMQQRLQSQQQQHQQQQHAKVAFTDLHCLSITSAEELIMEQALELEECGFFKGTLSSNVDHLTLANFADTDNAISSDSMADLHFKIKEEHHDMDLKLKTEEFETIKKQSICSSMESSPFSSPASMEFASSSALTTTDFSTSSFYLPPLTITSSQANSPVTTMRIQDARGTLATAHTYLPQLVASNVNVPDLIQINNNNQRYLKSSTTTTCSSNTNESLGNQIYLPITVNTAPVLIKTNQVLPPVDTLLFSNSKLGLFNNRNLPKQAATVQHNLS